MRQALGGSLPIRRGRPADRQSWRERQARFCAAAANERLEGEPAPNGGCACAATMGSVTLRDEVLE